MKTLSVFLMILVFLGIIPLSCGKKCDSAACECEDFSNLKDFDILSMDIKSTNSKNEVIDPTAHHDFEEAHKTIFVASKINVAANDQNSERAFFVNAAIACSPAIPTAIQKFSDIEITALNKIYFDNSEEVILEGTDITDRFLIAQTYSNNFQAIDAFLHQDYNIHDGDEFRIRLAGKPYKETELQLEIKITLSDGKAFVLDNALLRIR